MRTVHQVDPKAQLIVSTSHSHEDNGYTSGEDSSELDSMSLGSQLESSELKGLTTESDVLSAPKLMDGSGRVLDRPLGGLEQAVLLGWAQQVKKGTSADELQVCWMLQSGVTFHDRCQPVTVVLELADACRYGRWILLGRLWLNFLPAWMQTWQTAYA